MARLSKLLASLLRRDRGEVVGEEEAIGLPTHLSLAGERLLKVRNLRVAIPLGQGHYVDIIRGLDLDVKPGEIVGVVGESGSGKSVTMSSLLGLSPGGQARASLMQIDRIDLTNFKRDKEWVRIRGKEIGYIAQDPHSSLNPTRKIGKQLLNPTRKIGKQLLDSLPKEDNRFKSKAERKAYLIDLLERFGIKDAARWFNAYPHSLSGGMKQRVVIAMVVAARPKLIIADEPTTALDPTVQSAVLSLFEEIRSRFNISIIMISHNISVVAKLCDYIYIMYAGRVVEKGDKEAIFTNPKHPYTWALISAIPEGNEERFYTIQGSPPDMRYLPPGDPFAPRNQHALAIDYRIEPPLFEVDKVRGHYAATWLLHPYAKGLDLLPEAARRRIDAFKATFLASKGEQPEGGGESD